MPSNKKRRKKNKKEFTALIAILLLIAFGVYRFSAWTAERDVLRIAFRNPSGHVTSEFRMEVANTQSARNRGLMYRKPGDLAEDQGMLFVFPYEKVQSFWMKNTYLSLDIIFVNEEEKVVGLLHSVPVLNEAPRTVGRPSLYVVELLAGQAKKHGISVGSVLVAQAKLPYGN